MTWRFLMNAGPKTPEQAGGIVKALQEGAIEIIVAGHWSIEAFEAAHPSKETEAWLEKHRPAGPLDLACPVEDRERVEAALAALDFARRDEFDGSFRFEDRRGCIVNLTCFRRARDGGRIYPKLGLRGEDWYYPPECVVQGRLGSVPVKTEGPDGIDRARAAEAFDEA